MKKKGYLYLHTNGEFIFKPMILVVGVGANEYFDSPYVKKWWMVESEEEIEKIKADYLHLQGER